MDSRPPHAADWNASRVPFLRSLREIGVSYDRLAAALEARGWPRPSALPYDRRARLYSLIQPGCPLRVEIDAWAGPLPRRRKTTSTPEEPMNPTPDHEAEIARLIEAARDARRDAAELRDACDSLTNERDALRVEFDAANNQLQQAERGIKAWSERALRAEAAAEAARDAAADHLRQLKEAAAERDALRNRPAPAPDLAAIAAVLGAEPEQAAVLRAAVALLTRAARAEAQVEILLGGAAS